MFSADKIADVQGFNKVYQWLLKQIGSAILETGYTLTEKDVLLEISKTERRAELFQRMLTKSFTDLWTSITLKPIA